MQAELVVSRGLVQQPVMLLEHGDVETEILQRRGDVAAIPAAADDGHACGHAVTIARPASSSNWSISRYTRFMLGMKL